MNNFLAEKRRIELMEKDFNQLVTTSQAVESKLAQVTASDDTLQTMLIRIHKFDNTMAEEEERFQRLEKKNQTLETTNESIDRNFKLLLDTETGVKRMNDEFSRLSEGQEGLRSSIEKLSADQQRAKETADKLSVLDSELSTIEGRIKSMQVAREWLARTETRLEELDKEIQDRVKLLGSILKDEAGERDPFREKGAPPIGTRDSVVKLARQGWTVVQIADALKLSRAEVELIMEIGSKD
jgi:chromosome segregation ATPase